MRRNLCRPILVAGICIVVFSKAVVAEGVSEALSQDNREQPPLDPGSAWVAKTNPMLSNRPGLLERAWSLNKVAKEQEASGLYAESEALYGQALTLVEGNDKTAAFVTATLLNNLGEVYRTQARLEEAAKL